MSFSCIRQLLLFFLAQLCLSCYQLDTSRKAPQRESLGAEVYRILKQDLDRLRPAKGRALERERERFVRAVDTLLPKEQLHDIQEYLVSILPLFDDGLAVAFVRNLACVLEEVSTARDALRAWWWHFRPEGYGRGESGAALRRLLSYPGLGKLLSAASRIYLAHDGRDADGRPTDEDATLERLIHELSVWMRDREESITVGSWPEALVGFLLGEDARLEGEELWLVRTDLRGRARVAIDPRTGRLHAPFVDADGDGLADIDEESGDFIDADRRPLDAPAPFSSEGRRAFVDGYPVYQYVDLGKSLLVALLGELRQLVADGLLEKAVAGADLLLGPEQIMADERGNYLGHRTEESPLYALIHALATLGRYPRLPELLEALRVTLELREPQLARLLSELDRAGDMIEAYPASLFDHHRLYDDLIEHLREIAERGYLKPLLKAFADGRTRALPAGLAAMIRYRDHLDDQRPGGMEFSQPTDFSLSDALYENRSNFQKALHLVYDTNGAGHGIYVAGFDVFSIPDMLVFWLDSAADSGRPGEGLAHVPWYVVTAVQEFDTEYPPAEQVNRFINHDHDILGNPRGLEGRELIDYNGEALLALEVSGLLDGLRPLITALAARDRELNRPGTKVLADFLATLHPHFSQNTPGASPACAGLGRLQPLYLDILQKTGLIEALVDFLGSLDGLAGPQGREVIEEFSDFVVWLLAPDAQLRRHDGTATVLAADGLTPLSPFSPLYLFWDALRLMDQSKDADASSGQALDEIARLLYERFLAPEEIAGIFRIKNRHAWFVLLDTLDFLSRRLGSFRDRGELAPELLRLEQELKDALEGRFVAALWSAFQILEADQELAEQLDGLLLWLLDATWVEWPKIKLSAAWLLQDLLVDRLTVTWSRLVADYFDPEAAGRVFEPGVGCHKVESNLLPGRLMRLVAELGQLRPNGVDVFAQLLENAGRLVALPDGFPLLDFERVLCAVHRVDPDATAELSPQDYESIIFEIADYLTDNRRGLEKLYQMIERRFGLPAR